MKGESWGTLSIQRGRTLPSAFEVLLSIDLEPSAYLAGLALALAGPLQAAGNLPRHTHCPGKTEPSLPSRVQGWPWLSLARG